jgi:hypothetical protein
MECPRWRLTNPHYINVDQLPDGTKVEWEHKETNRQNGRTVRKLYPVPMLFDPKDPADHNYPGEIIVASAVEGARSQPNDIVFHGDPTQEMEPLNEEAEAITASLRQKWAHPIDTLPINGGMNAAEQAFMENMMKSFAQQIGASMQSGVSAPNSSVPREDYDALKERLEKLEALIASQNKPASTAERRA